MRTLDVSILESFKKLFAGKSKDSLPIADVAKRFELLGRTGQGSMSKAWRAVDRKHGPNRVPESSRQDKNRQVRSTFSGPETAA